MKAITIWQPWASLIACGAKRFETRSWLTAYRGPIAIHAAQKDVYKMMRNIPVKSMTAAFQELQAFYGIQGGVQKRLSKTQGCIIATAELVECWECIGPDRRGDAMIFRGDINGEWDNAYLNDDELLFGDFSKGRYAWELQNVKMLDTPIPAKGKQRIWNWEALHD